MSVDKIPTAEEWLNSRRMNISTYEEDMIEFTKMHVKEALNRVCDEAQIVWEDRGYESTPNGICKLSIIEAYPLENIK